MKKNDKFNLSTSSTVPTCPHSNHVGAEQWLCILSSHCLLDFLFVFPHICRNHISAFPDFHLNHAQLIWQKWLTLNVVKLHKTLNCCFYKKTGITGGHSAAADSSIQLSRCLSGCCLCFLKTSRWDLRGDWRSSSTSLTEEQRHRLEAEQQFSSSSVRLQPNSECSKLTPS